jgi:hypothetical protein
MDVIKLQEGARPSDPCEAPINPAQIKLQLSCDRLTRGLRMENQAKPEAT